MGSKQAFNPATAGGEPSTKDYHPQISSNPRVTVCRVAHYMPDSFSQIAEATVNFVHYEGVEDTQVMFSAGYGHGHRIVTCCSYQSKETENDTALQTFSSLPGRIEMHGTAQTGFDTTFSHELATFQKDVTRSSCATFTIRPDIPLMVDIHQEWEQVVEDLKDADGFLFSLGFSPVTKAMLANSPNAQGIADHLNPDDIPLFTVMLSPSWKSSTDDERIHRGIDRILAKCWAMTNEKALQHDSIFSTNAYYERNVFQEHGEKGLVMLQAKSQKSGLLTTAVPGTSKLNGPV